MKVKLSARSIKALEKLITGDNISGEGTALAPYLSGPKLVDFFNEFGGDDSYGSGGGFPSRWVYVQEKLRSHNETDLIVQVIETALAPDRFLTPGISPTRGKRQSKPVFVRQTSDPSRF